MNTQSGSPGQLISPKKRRRPALACVNCRRRKLRCDHARPCNNCIKSGPEDCIYPPTHTPAKQGRVRPSSGRRSRQAVDASSAHPPATQSPSTRTAQQHGFENRDPERRLPLTPSSNASTLQSHSQLNANGDKVDRLLARISELEGTVAKISEANHPQKDGPKSTDNATQAAQDSNSTSGPKFGNQSSWMNSTSLYTKVLRTLSKVQYGQQELIRTMKSGKDIARRVENSVNVQTSAISIGSRLPERPIADQLLSSYFNHFEGPFRVLHIPSFRDEYERFWNQRDEAADAFVLQLQLCMALGAISHQDSLLWKNASSQWLIEAQSWLHHSFVRTKKPLAFEELQVACLACLLEASVTGTDSIHHCWVQAGDLYRKAVCFGLHRDPKPLGNMTIRQAEMRRRLWVTILELNLLLSMQAGRTPLIITSEYDTSPPSNLLDEELDNRSLSEIDRDVTSERPTTTSAQLVLHASFEIRLAIITRVNSIRGEPTYDETLKLHSKLSKAEWIMQKKHSVLAQSAKDAYPIITLSHLLLSEVLVSRYFLALHLPKLGQSIKDPTFHFSRRICITTSLKLAEAAGILSFTNTREAAPKPPLEFKRLFINTMGVFRNLAIQAVFAIILELITFKEEQYENQGALSVWIETELFHHLMSIGEWTEEQLRAGTTDFRTHCYTRACIAYAEALCSPEGPQSTETAIANAALKSNESYCELMNVVAAKLGLFTGTSPAPTQEAERPVTSRAAVPDSPLDWVSGLLGGTGGSVEFDWTLPADSSADMNWFMTF